MHCLATVSSANPGQAITDSVPSALELAILKDNAHCCIGKAAQETY